VRLFKQVIEQNGQYVNNKNKEIQQTGSKSRIVSNMSISKSMDNMNITETNITANHVDDNFQIDFESINTLGAQFEINRSETFDASDFANIQENIEEYSGQIQEEISRTNVYSKANTIMLTLIMQKDKSSIADVLPSLEIMLSKWARMELYGEYNVLRNHLIAAFKHKFSYEIKSSIYSVAALLNISKLNIWYDRKDCLYIRKSANLNLLS
jgi:hypothetical protein